MDGRARCPVNTGVHHAADHGLADIAAGLDTGINGISAMNGNGPRAIPARWGDRSRGASRGRGGHRGTYPFGCHRHDARPRPRVREVDQDRAVRPRCLEFTVRGDRVPGFVDVDLNPERGGARLDGVRVEVIVEKDDGQLDGSVPGRPPGPDPDLDRRVELDVGAIGMEDGERTAGLRRVGVVVPRPRSDDRVIGHLGRGVLGRCAAGRQGEAEPSDAETGEGGATGDGRDGRGSSGCWHWVDLPSCERRCS